MNIYTQFGDWEKVRRIGCGLSGEVYEVRRKSDPRVVAALKVYVPSPTFTADQFRREIANARRAHTIISDGSPAVLDSDESAARPWFVMTLAKPLRGNYPVKTAVRLALRLIDLCIRLRDAGYYHCDIKKDNLCLIDGQLGILDFASLTRITFANTHDMRVGSDFHRAPETDCDRVVDERTEIYALAVTFLRIAGVRGALRYALPLVRALLPFPWMRYQTFEAFRTGLVREPLRIKRLVWLLGGVWKTKIVVRYTVSALVTSFILFIVIMAYLGKRYTDDLVISKGGILDREIQRKTTSFEEGLKARNAR